MKEKMKHKHWTGDLLNREKFSNESGILPNNRLLCNWSVSNPVSEPNDPGSKPVKSLSFNCRVTAKPDDRKNET
jgi:hypothetical protein